MVLDTTINAVIDWVPSVEVVVTYDGQGETENVYARVLCGRQVQASKGLCNLMYGDA
jgi:hypothetical protein